MGRGHWRTIGGTLIAGLVVRCPLVSLAPLLVGLERRLGIGPVQVGLLSALPVLCMGMFAPVTSRLWRVLGAKRTVSWALAIEALGVGLRGASASLVGLYICTFVAGAAAGVLNTALPAIVREWPRFRRETSTGAYGGALNLGAAVVSASSVPLAITLGSLSAGLDIWSAPVLVAWLVWLRWGPPDSVNAAPPSASRRPWRLTRPRGGRARLALVFVCLQAIVFYGVIAWLAPYYEGRGVHATFAGNLLAVLNAVEIVAMLVPGLGRARGSRRLPLAVAASSCGAGLVGLVAAPTSLGWLVAVLLGLGLGAMFPLGLLLISDCAGTTEEIASLGGAAFFLAYVGAAVSPVVLGALRDGSGSYGAGWLALLACNAGIAVVIFLWRDGARPPKLARADTALGR